MVESEPDPLPWLEEVEGMLTVLVASFLGRPMDGPLPLTDTHPVSVEA